MHEYKERNNEKLMKDNRESKRQREETLHHHIPATGCVRAQDASLCFNSEVLLLSWEIKTFLFSLQMSALGAARCAGQEGEEEGEEEDCLFSD